MEKIVEERNGYKIIRVTYPDNSPELFFVEVGPITAAGHLPTLESAREFADSHPF
jgi:hypothetical protein